MSIVPVVDDTNVDPLNVPSPSELRDATSDRDFTKDSPDASRDDLRTTSNSAHRIVEDVTDTAKQASQAFQASNAAKHQRGPVQDTVPGRSERGGYANARPPTRVTKSRAARRKKTADLGVSNATGNKGLPARGGVAATEAESRTPEQENSDPRAQTEDISPTILLQPETRPISHAQLVVEVRGIYAGLVMVEAKCIDVDEKQIQAAKDAMSRGRTKLSAEQWRALIALHKTLLHEHHDFFLASQHPAASPMLSGLAEKYAMPARLWRHAIFGFLEVLRHRLPESLDHMLAFIYIAYSMIALLYETALGFESTWIEALGDLSRYRMAVETEDMEVRQTWVNVSRSWYIKATDKDPSIGRLQHHLAILERPFSVRQLSRFTVSLTCRQPFVNAKTSIMSLLVPVLEDRSSVRSKADPVQFNFIKAHACLYTARNVDTLISCSSALIEDGLLISCIKREKEKFKDLGASIALANISAMLGYGQTTNDDKPLDILRLIIEQHNSSSLTSKEPTPSEETSEEEEDGEEFSIDNLSTEHQALARRRLANSAIFSFRVLSTVLRHGPDKNTTPLVHIYFTFLRYLAIRAPQAMAEIQTFVPWEDIVNYLNQLLDNTPVKLSQITKNSMPTAGHGSKDRAMVEDYHLRGQVYTVDYPPPKLFESKDVSDEERSIEQASMHLWRVSRVLWLAHKVATLKIWMTFDNEALNFAHTGFPEHSHLAQRERTYTSMQMSEVNEDGTLMASSAGAATMASNRTQDINKGQDYYATSHADRREVTDVDMEDVEDDITMLDQPSAKQPWIDTSRQLWHTPAKFELQGIDAENYPIKIIDEPKEVADV